MKAKQKTEKSQLEKLKELLKGFGITSASELDRALSEALDAMTIGIMTDPIINDSG